MMRFPWKISERSQLWDDFGIWFLTIAFDHWDSLKRLIKQSKCLLVKKCSKNFSLFFSFVSFTGVLASLWCFGTWYPLIILHFVCRSADKDWILNRLSSGFDPHFFNWWCLSFFAWIHNGLLPNCYNLIAWNDWDD